MLWIEVVSGWGTSVGRKSERLVVAQRNGSKQIALVHLDHLIVEGAGVALSSDVVAKCVESGIPITFVDGIGRPYASLLPSLGHGSAVVRSRQHQARLNKRSKELGREILRDKCENQARVLRYFAKNRRTRDPGCYSALRFAERGMARSLARFDEGDAISLEAQIASTYWAAVRILLPVDLGFELREHRGTQNAANAALNYGYGILQTLCLQACVLAGLEPFAGFVHVDRSGRQSMVLDLMEPFRPSVVDRPVLGMFGKGWKPKLGEDGYLAKPDKERVRNAILGRLEVRERYSGASRKLRNIVQMYARDLARELGGSPHVPYRQSW